MLVILFYLFIKELGHHRFCYFDGVTLEELPDLEKLFELNIYVYRLVKFHDEENDKMDM